MFRLSLFISFVIIILKLFGNLQLSWWCILIPPLSVMLCYTLFYTGIIMFVTYIFKKKRKK